jgi:hypothetical protein
MTGAWPDLRGYSRRRLSPLRTTIQCVEAELVRAISYDGRNWQLSALVESSPPWGSLNQNRTSSSFAPYAVWSQAEGIAHLPRAPHLDPTLLEQYSTQLLNFLNAAALPFPADDVLECWQLDRAGQALALLATAADLQEAETLRAEAWMAQVPGTTADPLAARVESLVRQTAEGGRRQWFRRLADGGGRTLPQRYGPAMPEYLAADYFCPLPLRERWPDAAEARWVQEYLDRQAVLLLTLPSLPAAIRARLEPAAWRQALEADRLHRLFPEVLDRPGFHAMRVEAALRRGS